MTRSLVPLLRHLALRRGTSAPEIAPLIGAFAYLGKRLAREVARSALTGLQGVAGGATNASGETQAKLDVVGNDLLIAAMEDTGLVSAVISEELAEPHFVARGGRAPFVVVADPLDGSSNTDNGGAVGTIFGVHRTPPAPIPLDRAALLAAVSTERPLAAGYILYGPSTMLVYADGDAVHGFTLERDIGEFLLTHEEIRCPAAGQSYSVNTARRAEWQCGIGEFLDHLNERDATTGRPYSLRYSGALVADVHRVLLQGGLYLYPADAAHPEGKLRQVYECTPLAFLMETAGGRAIHARGRTLETAVTSVHQRAELFIGGSRDVVLLERFLARAATSVTAQPR